MRPLRDTRSKLRQVRGIGLFAATDVAIILLAIFFPGKTSTVNFG
jgi:hypothetical protein